MNSVNLIPMQRRQTRRQARRQRGWVLGCVAYAALVAVAGLAAGSLMGPRGASGAQLKTVKEEIADVQAQIKQLKPRVDETRAAIETGRRVRRQPDWSILLAAVSKLVGEEVVLVGLRVDPMTPSATVAGPTAGPNAPRNGASSGFTVTLTGMGRTQSSVQQYVLRLQESGLFDEVTLLRTQRESLAGSDTAGFTVRCLLQSKRGVKPAARPATAPVRGGGGPDHD